LFKADAEEEEEGEGKRISKLEEEDKEVYTKVGGRC